LKSSIFPKGSWIKSFPFAWILPFIKRVKNVFITGTTGCGKSFIRLLAIKRVKSASKLGTFQCLNYSKTTIHRADGSIIKLAKLEKLNLLILDDWGLQPLPNEVILLQLIEDRHGRTHYHYFTITSE
jgi:DNA replication protein DnaC